MGKDGEKVVAKNVNVKTFMYAKYVCIHPCFYMFYFILCIYV